MDPQANIEEQEVIKARIKANAPQKGDHKRLKELRFALAEWKQKGGFAPYKKTK